MCEMMQIKTQNLGSLQVQGIIGCNQTRRDLGRKKENYNIEYDKRWP
ncbi:hypothetical protein HanPSC8_Chr06g0261231 [Helianthus annuus]|nr:hypothetical protein HanPSC8_Chr06g0261231 [Helianthus annuus]